MDVVGNLITNYLLSLNAIYKDYIFLLSVI